MEKVEKFYIEIGIRVFKDELEMNFIIYNVVIQVFVVCGNFDGVFDVYQEMRNKKFVFDEYIFISLLVVCCFDLVEGFRLVF